MMSAKPGSTPSPYGRDPYTPPPTTYLGQPTGSLAGRLGHALSGHTFTPLNVGALPHYQTTPVDPATATDALLWNIDHDWQRAETVVPAKPKRPIIDLRRFGLFAVAALTAAATVLGLTPGAASSASAAIIAPSPTSAVTAGPVTTIRIPAWTTSRVFDADAVFTTPSGMEASFPVTGTTTRSGWIWADIPSTLVTPGAMRLEVVDNVDGRVTPILVQVRRQTRVSAPAVLPFPGGAVVTGIVSHYTPSGYQGDQASPVQIQTLRAGKWVTLTTVTTSSTATGLKGTITTVVNLPAGRNTLRLVRQQGANVTGGVGAKVTATIPAVRPARG